MRQVYYLFQVPGGKEYSKFSALLTLDTFIREQGWGDVPGMVLHLGTRFCRGTEEKQGDGQPCRTTCRNSSHCAKLATNMSSLIKHPDIRTVNLLFLLTKLYSEIRFALGP